MSNKNSQVASLLKKVKSRAGENPVPHIIPLLTSALLGTSAGIAIWTENSCCDSASTFTPNKIFNICVLILAIGLFLYSISPTIIYIIEHVAA